MPALNPAKKPNIAVIICAAGFSNRMSGKKKEYLPLPSSDGRQLTVLGAVVTTFASCKKIGPIIITVPAGDEETARSCLPTEFTEKQGRIIFAIGGSSRRTSVHNALLCLKELKPSHVLIHDGARPWIKKSLIEEIIDATLKHGAVIPVLPLVETPKELNNDDPGFIKRHLRRDSLCTAQTPQGFSFPEILKAHEKAAEREREGFIFTDDAEVWGEFIGRVAVISGDPENRKITYIGDLENGK